MKTIVVLGSGGFIGNNLVHKLKSDPNNYVIGADLKKNEFREQIEHKFILADLRNHKSLEEVIPDNVDEIYQLAADMGGSTYINTGEHDSDVMYNSSLINLNVLNRLREIVTDIKIKNTNSKKNQKKIKIFYASSACVYPEFNQLDPQNPKCTEDSTYPALPDSEYGWEKLFSERLYKVFNKDFPQIEIRLGRFHNIYGPYGTYEGGKEKAPAAFCRKVVKAKNNSKVEVYGDGKQTRSFLYIDECIEGILRFMESDFEGPLNIGSDEMISMNDFMNMIIKISKKNLTIKNTEFHGTGVRGRNSDNKLIEEKLGWKPNYSLLEGISKTYKWILDEINT